MHMTVDQRPKWCSTRAWRVVLAYAGCIGIASSGVAVPSASAADPNVFVVAKYPVGAEARNAVAAKRKAIADGQISAFRSLLRRLVPVTRYAQIRSLPLERAAELVDGVAVASERNSRTRYEASLNFSFREKAVRKFLDDAGVAFVDTPADPVTVVLAYRPPEPVQGAVPKAYQGAAGVRLWRSVWRDLDLTNALTPVRLELLRKEIHSDTIKMLIEQRGSGMRILAGEYGVPRVVLAMVQPDLAAKRLSFWLAGQDAVGPLSIKRALRFEPEDFEYTMELAAVIALGIVEGRWKAVSAPSRAPAAGALAANNGVVEMTVRFQSLRDWKRIRDAIERVPGVENVEINGLSTRDAQIAVSYRKGQQALRDELARDGLNLLETDNGLLLQ